MDENSLLEKFRNLIDPTFSTEAEAAADATIADQQWLISSMKLTLDHGRLCGRR